MTVTGKIENDNARGRSIAERILLTLQIADRRGYGMNISHLSRRLLCKGTSTFLGGLYSSHAGITTKPSLCVVGD